MDYSKIVFTIELDGADANVKANELLQKGWLLLSVGSKVVGVLNDNSAYYTTTYVLGANQDQYRKYVEGLKNDQAQLDKQDDSSAQLSDNDKKRLEKTAMDSVPDIKKSK
jgi:hypothetical protein